MTDEKKDNWIIKMLRAVKAFFDNPDKEINPILTGKELESNSPPKQTSSIAESHKLSPAIEELTKLAEELKQASPAQRNALEARMRAIMDELIKKAGLKIVVRPSSPENRSTSSSPIGYTPPPSSFSPWGR